MASSFTIVNNTPLSAAALSIINHTSDNIISVEETQTPTSSIHTKWELRIVIQENGIISTFIYECHVDTNSTAPIQYSLFPRVISSAPPVQMNAPASMPAMHQKTGAVANSAISTVSSPTVMQFGNYHVQTTPYHNCNLHLAHNAEGQPVLCRLIRGNDANALARFNSREGPALFALRAATLGNNCPCLVRILEQIDNPDTADKLVVFQNLISGYQFTRLSLLMQQNPTGFQEQFAMSLFVRIAHAVMECHNAGVCVRDITPQRIFVYRHQVDGNIRISTVLADLSQAMVVPASGIISDRSGTPAYVAPEIMQHASYNAYYADAWSLGVLLHVLLTGHLPWPTSVTPSQLLFMITGVTPTINLLDNIHVSQEARALVAGLMNRNLNQRITVANAINSAAAILSIPANFTTNATDDNKDKDPSSGAN